MMLFQILVDTPTAPVELTTSSSIPWGIILIVFLVIVAIIVALNKLIRALKRPTLMDLSREQIIETWTQIEQTAEQGLMGSKLAVIEADKLLDNVLRNMSFPGENMAERLKLAQYKYPAINQVWPAHKLRNQLVHDSAFQMSTKQAKYALKQYKDALQALHVF